MTIAYIISGGLGDFGGGSYPTATEIATAVLVAATIAPIAADVKKMNNTAVTGTGVAGDLWRG